jgi:hypothetical protein
MTMTCYERIEAAWNLEEADRVPVAPLVIYLIPYQAGLSFTDMLAEPEMVGQAAIDQQDLIGDGIHPVATFFDHQFLLPTAGWDQVTLNWRIFERFPPDGNIPNAYFDKVIIDDYEEILENGFAQLIFNRQIDSNVLRLGVDEWLYRAFEYPPRFAQGWRRFTSETGKSLLFGARTTVPFEYPIYYRGFPLLIEDLLERPEQVKAYCQAVVEYETFMGMHKATIMGAGQVPGADAFFFQAGYPGPPYFSPAVFEEFIYPTMKQGVDEAVKRGYRVHVHLDGDMTLVLDQLSHITDGLPKGMVMLDFEKTDMKKAKEVLGDKVCIYGNVPAAMLCFGTPYEVDAYCRQLIEDCAPGGGFILGTECEVPWNAKPENVRAIMAAADKYGQYGQGTHLAAYNEERLLARVRRRILPPTTEEFNHAVARWLFGSNADKMMQYAPWSFLLAKLMWKPSEVPWARE